MRCHRIKPLNEYTYIVCNQCDHDEFVGSKGLVDDMGDNIAFKTDHVIPNGCSSASEWRGELHDLKAAIKYIGEDKNLLVISCACVVWPEYNFERILEHPIVRGTNVLAFAELTPTDIKLH